MRMVKLVFVPTKICVKFAVFPIASSPTESLLPIIHQLPSSGLFVIAVGTAMTPAGTGQIVFNTCAS